MDGLHDVTVIQELGKCYGWHPLIVEDILNTHQRTKMDVFDDYIFISLKMLTYNSEEMTMGENMDDYKVYWVLKIGKK